MQTLRIPRAQGLEEQFSSHPTPLRKRKERKNHQLEFCDYIPTESSWRWWQLCGNGREALHPPAMLAFNGKLHHIPKPDTWCEGHLTDILSWVVPRKRQWLQLCIRQLRETADSWEQHTDISRHLLNGGSPLEHPSPGGSNKCPQRSSREPGSISTLLTQAMLLTFLNYPSSLGKFPC